jgi:hypothetical protein
VTDDVVYPQLLGHRCRIIIASVIDNQGFDVADAGNVSRHAGQGLGEGFGFVVAGDLDDEFYHLFEGFGKKIVTTAISLQICRN